MTPATSVSPPAGRLGAPRLTADERRAEIVEAAVRAFGSGGLAGTSTEDIARLAGVSQPYLFRLFGTKRDLFLAAVGRSYDRIGEAFEAAAANPATDDDAALVMGHKGAGPQAAAVLLSIARVYHGLLADQSLLRLQLHAFAACDDPEVRAYVRGRFSGLVRRVGELTGTDPVELRAFFAEGMLLNVASAMELTDGDVAWELLCAGGPA